MAVDLVRMLRTELSGHAATKMASLLGESAGATQSALDAVVPAVFSAITQKISAPDGASDVLQMFQQTASAGGGFGSLGSFLAGGAASPELVRLGGSQLSSLFGNRQAAVTDWLASSSGVSHLSASALLRLAVPFVLGGIGRHAGTHGGLTLDSITSLLAGQPAFAAPQGLARALGKGGVADFGGSAIEATAPVGTPASMGRGWMKWVLPIAALAVLSLGWLGFGSAAVGKGTVSVPGTTPATSAVAGVRSVYGVDLGALLRRTLPGGDEINIPEKGVESQLIAVIEDASRPVASDQWFTLDRLEFETGSAALEPAASEQLANVAAILAAYPNVALKVGGYTDSGGDDDTNMKLSRDRAANTMNELVAMGVSTSRLEAEGYGEQFPVDSNDTPTGRQRNRRIDVRVTRK